MPRLSHHSMCRLGPVAVTPNARTALTDEDLERALRRHSQSLGAQTNQPFGAAKAARPLTTCRFLSVHNANSGAPFWVITEPDGSTAVLLPKDYSTHHGCLALRFSLPAFCL